MVLAMIRHAASGLFIGPPPRRRLLVHRRVPAISTGPPLGDGTLSKRHATPYGGRDYRGVSVGRDHMAWPFPPVF